MDASTEGLVDACEHHGTTIQMDTKAEDFLRNLNDVLCLLWMLQQTELSWHVDIVKVVKVCVMFTMGASSDGLVVAYRHCYNLLFLLLLCYVISTRLAVEVAV